jgi:hypothetical protein
MATALIVTLGVHWSGLWSRVLGRPEIFAGSAPVVFAKTALTVTVITTVVWVLVTYLTSPESQEVLLRFYRKVHPDVRGWMPIAAQTPEIPATRDIGRNLRAWVLGCAMVYLALFGAGKALLHQVTLGLLLLAGSVVAGWLLYVDQSRHGWGAQEEAASKQQLAAR